MTITTSNDTSPTPPPTSSKFKEDNDPHNMPKNGSANSDGTKHAVATPSSNLSVHQDIQAGVASVHKNDAEVAALWQEFDKLAPLDDLGLEAGNVIELEDDNVWSDEDCAAETDETYDAKTEQLPSRSSTVSEPDNPAVFLAALQRLLESFGDNKDDVEGIEALFQEEAANEHESPALHNSFLTEWKLFVEKESEISKKDKDELCVPTGELGAPLLIQLNHPTMVSSQRPGTTLDPTCATTRILIEKGVNKSNSFVFDTFNRRCHVRHVKKDDGRLWRTFETEPSTWTEELQKVHEDLIEYIWYHSPGKVLVLAGKENRRRFFFKFGSIRRIRLKEGFVEAALMRREGKIVKVVLFVWHPEFVNRSQTLKMFKVYDAVFNFAFHLCGLKVDEHAWERSKGSRLAASRRKFAQSTPTTLFLVIVLC
jgi:hypothetical protein